ncbi:putative Ig domain-containing protein [Marinimicrobium sp. ARAG 43.8]|uniref:putative Ig domain-containing protein n=1 Tax=Marinimicrobium sp. ARAG 43.8 TaxID=3418719 RepID=UPI003CE7E2AB
MKTHFIRKACSALMAGVLLFAVLAPASAWASHFRGGSITWQSKDIDGNGGRNDVVITVNTAWGGFDSSVSFMTTPSLSTTQIGSSEYVYVNGTGFGDADYTLRTDRFEALNLDENTAYLVVFQGSARISNLRNNSNGAWRIQTRINLRDGNLAPKIDMPIILEVPKLQSDEVTPLDSWTYNLKSTDPNADKLRYRLANLDELGGGSSTNPPGLSINPNTGVITWVDSGSVNGSGNPVLQPGLYSAGIVAEDVDESGNVKSKTHVDLILSLEDKAQVEFDHSAAIPETRNVIVEKGDSFSFNISGTAIDTQSLGTVQGALTEDSPDNYTFDPGPMGTGLDPGSYPITFEVRDQSDSLVNNYLGVTFIVPDPNAPRVHNLEADKVTYSGTDAVRVDDNQDAIVTDANTTEFQGGFLKSNVTFTDGQLEVLGIDSEGDGPGQIRRGGDTLFFEGNAFGTIHPSLNGEGRALRIDFTGPTSLDALQALVRSLSYRDTFVLRAEGDRSLSLYIRDPEGLSTSNDFFVHVEPHPQSGDFSGPPLEAANTITLVEGDALALSNENISYADPEGDAITFEVVSISHGHFALVSNQSTPITTFTQDDINLGRIAFVHDGGEEAPTYEITATDGVNTTEPSAGQVNFTNVSDNAPAFSNSPDTSATEGQVYSYVPTVDDDDLGDTHTFSITHKPDWATFDSETGTLSGTPGPADIGTNTDIGMRVTDSGGLSDDLELFDITVSAAEDSDGDGVPDYVEDEEGTDPGDDKDFPDTDGDGVPDYVEENIDGTDPEDPEDFKDTDGDGVPDYVEENIDDTDPEDPQDYRDTDGDGVPDYLENDHDNDGISDDEEGRSENRDSDGDGIPDYLDLDSDNDGIPDVLEGTVDTDGDGLPDYIDNDSDNDGIPDYIEAPLAVVLTGQDSDYDGIDDALDVDFTGGQDLNGNGIDDAFEPRDTDGDGVPDFRDPDSDGDGIPDRIEADMIPLSGIDSDGDGIDDFLDVDQTGGRDLNGDGIDDDYMPVDSDGDGVPDYRDPDSDNDGLSDRAESGASGFDSDGDGIDDTYDVDQTGGVDANGDGVDDDVRPLDSDGDGIPDYRDLDSDNDGINDVLEAGLKDDNRDGMVDDGEITDNPRDSDGDGIPDYRDLDSNGDGVNDVVDAGYEHLDEDGDGRIDNDEDVDGDGIPDVVDNEIGSFGGTLDSDGDGVPDAIDLDSDNDGIPDVQEGRAEGRDTDGDGIPDYLDLDSDNDGIPDILESGLGFLTDDDGDGRIDNFVDANGDGLHDTVDVNMIPRDTDGDGQPDYIDLDSDGDGIWDLIESGTDPSLDADNDGRIDVFVDRDRDGIADSVDGVVLGGSAGTPPTLRDTDGDGLPDYIDTDSDNDGFTDDLENGDFDGDGIPDSQQDSGELQTAVKGSGAVGFWWLAMLALLAPVRRLGRCALALVMVTGGVVALPAQADDCGANGYEWKRCWYVGVGVGASHLDPEGRVNGWGREDSSSVGYEVHLGQYVRSNVFWELKYTDAGEAGLSNLNPALTAAVPNAAIEYKVPSLMVGYVVWSEFGAEVFAKAGFSGIRTSANDARIGQRAKTSTQLALGAGVNYRLPQLPWQLTLSLDSYDRDARMITLGVSRRFDW